MIDAPVRTVFPIGVRPAMHSRLAEVDVNTLTFGSTLTDHYFSAEYADGQWHAGTIEPMAAMEVSPAVSGLHYGQSIFEGMKAFRTQEGGISLFRPADHLKRLNASAQRLVMPAVPEELFLPALHELLRVDEEWMPTAPGASLYIRPLLFGLDDVLGVRPATRYRLIIMLSPAASYFSRPVKSHVCTHYVRAAEDGVGNVKMAGNYARSMAATQEAKAQGCDSVLFMDARERRFLEEFATMNVFVVIDGVLITPSLRGTILPGITRSTVLALARGPLGLKVQERPLAIEEVVEAHQHGVLQECFGTGTAAVIQPVVALRYQDVDMPLPEPSHWKVVPALSQLIQDIRTGQRSDTFGWMDRVV